jgi:hypothetical protein
MSLVLQSSGGGQITIQEPNTASNFTATLPAATGDVMVSGNMPAFSAYPDATQSITGGTWTKMQFNIEDWDTASAYDNATNYRFTPQVAGYYQVNGSVESNAVAQNFFLCGIYKNGSQHRYGNNNPTNASAGPDAIVSAVVFLNGSTDYVELWAVGQNSWTRGNNGLGSYFQATLIRTA